MSNESQTVYLVYSCNEIENIPMAVEYVFLSVDAAKTYVLKERQCSQPGWEYRIESCTLIKS